VVLRQCLIFHRHNTRSFDHRVCSSIHRVIAQVLSSVFSASVTASAPTGPTSVIWVGPSDCRRSGGSISHCKIPLSTFLVLYPHLLSGDIGSACLYQRSWLYTWTVVLVLRSPRGRLRVAVIGRNTGKRIRRGYSHYYFWHATIGQYAGDMRM